METSSSIYANISSCFASAIMSATPTFSPIFLVDELYLLDGNQIKLISQKVLLIYNPAIYKAAYMFDKFLEVIHKIWLCFI